MKRLAVFLLALALLLSLAACGGKAPEAPAAQATATNTPSESGDPAATPAATPEATPETTPETTPSGSTDPAGGVSTDVGKDTVTITIPADFVNAEENEEEILADAQEDGILDVVINEDGSATYTMTREKHEEMLREMAEDIEEGILEYTEGEEKVPSFLRIEHDPDYGQFDIYVDAAQYSDMESFYAMGLVISGALYQAYAGKQAPDSVCKLVNADTGEEMDRVTYQDWLDFVESLSSFGEGEDWGSDWGSDWETYSIALPELEPQVILDEGGVRVTVTGFSEEEFWGQGVKVLVENNSDLTVFARSDLFAVNDLEMSGGLYSTVTPGNKAEETIYFNESDVKTAGITNIGKITIQVAVLNDDTYEELFNSGIQEITTSDYGTAWEISLEGETIYDDNGVVIRFLGIEEDAQWDTRSLVFYVENNSDKALDINGESMAINGFMTDPWVYMTLHPGFKAVAMASVDSSTLESSGLDHIESAEISFSISDSLEWEVIGSTGTIQLPLD